MRRITAALIRSVSRKSCFVSVISAVVLFSVTVSGKEVNNKAIHRAGRPIPGSYIVLLNDAINDEPQYILDDLAKSSRARLRADFMPLLKGGLYQGTDAQAQAILNDPRVKSVWEDEVLTAAGSVVPRSWNLDRIDERMSPRLDNDYTYCSTGSSISTKVRAYIVDSGIWGGHDEFSNPDPSTGATRVPLGFDIDTYFYGYPNRSNNPPCNYEDTTEGVWYGGSHGTAVASVLGGRTLGVAPEVTLIPVRVLACNGGGGTGDVLKGISWIPTDPDYRPTPEVPVGRVVNMSFQSTNVAGVAIGDHPLEQAIASLIGQGITVVVAAGNYNSDTTNYAPARYPLPIVVGGSKGRFATDVDMRWDDGPTGNVGSNWGTSIDLFAPADRVLVAHWFNATATRDPNDSRWSSGTSFAAPLVAGAAARLLQFYPGETNSQIESRLVTNTTNSTYGLNMTNRGTGSPNLLLHVFSDCKRRAL